MLASQLAWLLLADSLANPSRGWSRYLGLTQPETQQRYYSLLVHVGWAPPLLVFLWGLVATCRAAVVVRGELQVARWAWPALGLWSIAEVIVTPGWRTGQLAYAQVARFFAMAQLDHPWSCAGALVAAGLLLAGAARVRDAGARLVLGSLAGWALVRSWLEASTLWVAARTLSTDIASSVPASLGAASFWVARLSGLLLLTAAMLSVQTRLRTHATGERLSFRTLLGAFGLASLTLFDVARVSMVPYLAAAERLQYVTRELDIMPAQGVPGEDAVPSQFALLNAVGELTVVDADRVYALGAARSLPVLANDLLLIADPRCPTRRVRELVADSRAPASVRLGQLVGARDVTHAVRWVRIMRERADPSAPGEVDLSSLPQEHVVGQLDWSRALYVSRSEVLPVAAALRDARIAPAVGAAHLYEL